MNITVYTKPSCVQCDSTYRALDSRDMEYDTFDLSEDPRALQEVKELGYLQAPVVVARSPLFKDGIKHWSGFRPDEIEKVAQLIASLQNA